MAGITLADAEEHLAVWLAADKAVAAKQSYTINGRSLTLVDAPAIRKAIMDWNNLVKELSGRGGKIRVRGVTPIMS